VKRAARQTHQKKQGRLIPNRWQTLRKKMAAVPSNNWNLGRHLWQQLRQFSADFLQAQARPLELERLAVTVPRPPGAVPHITLTTHGHKICVLIMTVVSNDPSWWLTISWNRFNSYFIGSWRENRMTFGNGSPYFWHGFAVASSTIVVYEWGEQPWHSTSQENHIDGFMVTIL
jgi:hypothetical protein